ncbi:erythrocyte membrane protein 1, PfEMP1, putative [Plasmodium reichenowi]|uniref:Erythrocyte membrane protein 1, PfEMP1, putative n=1 Tax=Plasmodium reichenowi TaxID=5854 RepID=A0A2P9DST3_PLARE|nr:erythrocyte membrane protein 1, PfEMP1, putative [Plasmodium reichenowi]
MIYKNDEKIPSDIQNDIPSDNTIPNSDNTIPTSDNTITTSDTTNTPSDTPPPITDNEWNELKQNFISNMLQSEPNDLPNNNISANTPMNTQPNTLYFDKPEEKPFIMSIHDRNLYTGEEYNYDMSNNISNNDLYSGSGLIGDNRDSYSGTKNPISDNRDPYSGIDLINDSLNSGNQPIDIYDELLKRKENELFGTNHVKHTSTHSVASPTNNDPIHNQLELFHKWLDRHRDMCEKWDKNNKVDILNQLKEKWENDTSTSGNTPPTSDNTPPNSDIHSGKLSDIHSGKLSDIHSGKLSGTPSDNNIHSDIHPSDIPSGKLSDTPSYNKMLNTDVSIEIDMDNPKPTNEFTYVDTILEDLDKPFNEPYYYDMYDDDIYYDVNDDNDTSTVNPNNMEKPTKIQIEMDVNKKTIKEKYPISDIWNI